MLKNKLLGLHLAAPTVAIAFAGAVATVSFAQVTSAVTDPEKLVIETDAGTQLASYGIDMMKK